MSKKTNKMSMKRIGKSAFALLLTVAMLFSVIPLSASAADLADDPIKYSVPEGYPNHNPEDYPISSNEGYTQLQKSAKWTNGTKTTAEIEMHAYGTPIAGQGADAVIVLDRSGSMESNKMSDGRTRMVHAQEAAVAFAKDLLDKDLNASSGRENTNRVAVVSFSNTSTIDINFTGVDGYDNVKAAINGLKATGTTDYTAGMKNAEALFKQLDEQGITIDQRPRYVVFLSDGQPNISGNNNINDPAINGKDQFDALRAQGVTVYMIGFQLQETYRTLLRGFASPRPSGQVGANGESVYLFYPNEPGELGSAYDDIFDSLKLAGTSAKVVDTIDDKFELDPSQGIRIDGKEVSAGASTYTLSNNNRTITWHMGDIIDFPGKSITIPVVLKKDYHDVDGLYPTNEGQAYMTYINFNDKSCRQNVASPTLAKPYAGVHVIYYETDENGNALDYAGHIINDVNELKRYQNQLKVTTVQWPAGQNPYEAVADDYISVNAGDFKFATNGKYNSNGASKNCSVDVSDNAVDYVVYFGYRKLKTSDTVTLNKTYTPAVPDHITDRAGFRYEEVGKAGSGSAWSRSGDTYTATGLKEDSVYKVTETALKGYIPVEPFHILYDGTKLVYVDEDGKAATPPATITVSGMSVTVQNVQDLDQTDETFYVVKYYKDKKLVDADTITRKKEVWTNAAEIPVDAADVNIVNKYYGYKCVSPASVPTSVPRETVIEVYYEEDHGQTEKREYTVEYFWNNEYRETVKYESEEWVGKSTITLQDFKDYSASGYQLERTNPANLTPGTTELSNNAKIQAYYTVDSQTQPIDYVIQYYKNGTLVTEDVQPLSKDVWYLLNTASVYKAEIDYNKYPDMVVDHIEFDGKTVTKYPITITRGAANEIKVYYVEDMSGTTEITYTVNYYQYGDHINPDEQITRTVQVQKENPKASVGKSDVDTLKYANQVMDEGASTQLPAEVADGDEIHIYYVKDTTKLKEGSYEIHYYKEGTYVEKTIVKKVVWAGDEKITVEKNDFETEKYAGYLPLADADVSPGYGAEVDFGETVTATYRPNKNIKDNSFTFKYNIYYGTEDDGFSLLRTEDVTVGPLWVGTEEISLTRQSDGSYLDEIGNTAVYAEIPHPTTGGKLGILTDTDPLKVKRGGTINVYYEYLLMIDIPLTGTVKVTSGRVKPNDFAGVITGTCTDSSLPITMDGTVSSTGVITFTVTGGVAANTVLGKELEFVIRQDPEQSSAKGSYTWDTSVYTVKLRLSKSASGEISVTILSGASIVFTNRPK